MMGMSREYSIYCDESCHLGQDEFMVIGAIWCDKMEVRNFTDRVKLLRTKHAVLNSRETKWTQISNSKKNYFLDLIRLFFSEEGVNFRCIVIPTAKLNHGQFNQSADDFYYKAQYIMLKNIVAKRWATFKIFLDYKDAWSNVRGQRLAEYLNSTYVLRHSDFACQPVRSNESIMLQTADVLIGAVASKNNRPNTKVQAKKDVISLIEELSGQSLLHGTPYGVDKFNIFRWHDEGKE